jgi:hypothetical protein
MPQQYCLMTWPLPDQLQARTGSNSWYALVAIGRLSQLVVVKNDKAALVGIASAGLSLHNSGSRSFDNRQWIATTRLQQNRI